MRKLFAAACVTLSLASVACTTGTASAVDLVAEEQLIRGVSMQWLEYERAKNAAAIAGLFAEDGTLFRENQEPVVGAAAIVAYIEDDYAKNPSQVVSWTTDRVEVAGSGDVAAEYGTWNTTNGGQAGNESDNGKYITTYRKINGTWKVVGDISLSTKPDESAVVTP
jgi:uncharacterized protein (TIGR02246 family)